MRVSAIYAFPDSEWGIFFFCNLLEQYVARKSMPIFCSSMNVFRSSLDYKKNFVDYIISCVACYLRVPKSAMVSLVSALHRRLLFQGRMLWYICTWTQQG
jgi:phospholipid N-methyltransferase